MRKAAQVKSFGKTILVVDDEPQMLNIVSEFLCGHYHIITANNGVVALERAQEYKSDIDVLLSDFQMVGMMGSELATRLTLARPGIKVLLMSSYSEGTLALNEGWHFLPKPFSLSHLRTLVTSLAYPGTAREEPLLTTQREQVVAG